MISNISFGSTYIVSNRNNSFEAFSNFQQYALDKEMEDGVHVRFHDHMKNRPPYTYTAEYTMVAPDSMDYEIEKYCAYRNIEYKKLSDNLMDIRAIQKRIAYPEKGMRKTNVNVEKLEKLVEKQDSNMKHCQKDYYTCYNDSVDYMLKSGERFPATTLLIQPISSTKESVMEYIEAFGAQNMLDNQVFVDFLQQTSEPDHCVYFALRDMGVKNIPVYVDYDTYELGNAIGLFE